MSNDEKLDRGVVMADCNLIELPYEGGTFTWSHGSGSDLVFDRLGRSLGTIAWCALFPYAVEKRLHHRHSDHFPIHVTTSKSCASFFGTRPFRYKDHWVMYENCKEVVKQVWEAGSVVDPACLVNWIIAGNLLLLGPSLRWQSCRFRLRLMRGSYQFCLSIRMRMA